MKNLLLILFLLKTSFLFSQGFNHAWLLGYYPFGYQKARINFNSTNFNLLHEQRKMGFEGTEGNISDSYGNFLMSSNGVWIANANNDTMMNGTGLNPGPETTAHPNGLLLPYANVFLPYPGDSTKYLLFHHTDEWDGYSYPTYEINYSVIDITLDNGLGGVISKNETALLDTLIWGLAACKHANGRDWWIVALKNNSDIVFKILFTPSGIQSVTSQNLNVPFNWYNVSQPTFSPDGNKFTYNIYDTTSINNSVLIFNFDRCTGMFSNEQIVPVTSGTYLWGLAFSPNSNYIYATSFQYVFQIDVNLFSVDTVASNDGFASPFPPFYTTFMLSYLAANGKIYITSGNSTSHIHVINYPDSVGVNCDVQQHSLSIDTTRHFRNVPNHPNYYLGCDTTGSCAPCYVGIDEPGEYDFRFSISPNPNNGNFKISYLLPQNQKGTVEVFDISGKCVYELELPQWSTMQIINLPTNISSGIYNCVISSGDNRKNIKLALLRD